MDWLKGTETLKGSLKRYRLVLLVIIFGLLLMCLPEKKASQAAATPVQQQEERTLEASLQEILSKIQGAGKVAVLLTESEGRETLYQMDGEKREGESDRQEQRQTVILTDPDRAQQGLIRQINPPRLQGAVVVCQGGDDPKVKLAIVEAVMRATGLPSHCICVLKMK